MAIVEYGHYMRPAVKLMYRMRGLPYDVTGAAHVLGVILMTGAAG